MFPASAARRRARCLAARIVRKLGHRQVDVLGISWGGGLAQQLALQHARLVRRLVLVGTSTGSLMIPAHPRVLRHMLTPRRFLDKDYAASIAPILYGGSARTHPEQVHEILGDTTRIGSPTGYLHQLLAGVGWTSLPWLPFIRQPTLILAGDDDPIVPPANGRLLCRLIPNAELLIYHGGHLALATEAEELAPVVARFLTAPPANHQNEEASHGQDRDHRDWLRRFLLPPGSGPAPISPPSCRPAGGSSASPG